jgi:hypothetical protein
MAGEISPDIMFLRVWTIWVFTGVEGYLWILLGALGRIGMDGTKNNRKRSKNDRVVIIL